MTYNYSDEQLNDFGLFRFKKSLGTPRLLMFVYLSKCCRFLASSRKDPIRCEGSAHLQDS
ncbi:Uncharacterised protein [Streptococcus downei MFe28]|uniref:Uncharacterized protein n=1 Tax=Streptococcus downei MFe28 TaxID=764290 RepID=A0A380JCG3_STRDO|nr:Uncharacterised protein [Streptococcus downei MFe28]